MAIKKTYSKEASLGYRVIVGSLGNEDGKQREDKPILLSGSYVTGVM